jgi:hypothetical protein
MTRGLGPEYVILPLIDPGAASCASPEAADSPPPDAPPESDAVGAEPLFFGVSLPPPPQPQVATTIANVTTDNHFLIATPLFS